MLKKIYALRANENVNISEIEYLEKVYAKELQEHSDLYTEVYSSLFHTEIPEEIGSEGFLAKHYNSDETAINTETILNTKNAFLDYLERNASELNNYRQILSLTEATENALLCQEIQESKQHKDWRLTAAVLDFACNSERYTNIGEFFKDPIVSTYITPTRIGKSRLYVRALRGSKEIQDLAKYLIENIKQDTKNPAMTYDLKYAVRNIMPAKQICDIHDAFRTAKPIQA